MEFSICEIDTADAGQLAHLYAVHLREVPIDAFDPIQFEAQLAKITEMPGYHILAGKLDGKLICSVSLIIIPNLTHNFSPYAVIENVVTHADYRNSGYASALMTKADSIATNCGCYKIMLLTGSKKRSTLQFYQKCGYNSHDKTAFIKWL